MVYTGVVDLGDIDVVVYCEASSVLDITESQQASGWWKSTANLRCNESDAASTVAHSVFIKIRPLENISTCRFLEKIPGSES